MSEDNNDSAEDDWAAAMDEQGDGDTGASADDEFAAAMAEQAQAESAAAPLEQLADDNFSKDENVNLDVILDIPVTIALEIGRNKISIRNLLKLNQGSVVELDRLAGEPLDVLVNNTLIAHGEVVVVNDKFGIRLTDVVSPEERIKNLK